MSAVNLAFFASSGGEANGSTQEIAATVDSADQRGEPDSGYETEERLIPTAVTAPADRALAAADPESFQSSAASMSFGRGVVSDRTLPRGATEGERPEDDKAPPAESGAASATPNVELPVTHAPLVNDTPIESDYAELQSEERDESWASGAESLLYTHVVGHPAGREVGVVAALCKQTQCWLIGTAYGENGRENWEAVRGDFRQQPLFTTYFAGIVGESSAAAPDGHRFVTLFLRAGYQPEPMFPE